MLNPLTIKLLTGAGIILLAFGAGWTANGWRLKTDLAELKAVNAESISQASQVALEDYKAAAEVVAGAALGAQTDLSAVNAQLAAIRRNQKNAPPPPLPADCKPGPIRLRNLAESAAAADAAIARPVPGK